MSKKKNEKIENDTFQAIDKALNLIEAFHRDCESSGRDAVWAISDHLKSRSELREEQSTFSIAVDLATPNHELKRLNLGSALHHASDDVVLDLIQFLNQTQQLCEFVSSHEPESSNIRHVADHVAVDRRAMKREVESEICKRVELYRIDIENKEADRVK